MKNAFLILTLALQAAAQPVETPPGQPAPAPGGLPASPTAPGLPASPFVSTLPASPTAPGTAGFTNAGGIFSLTNSVGTNLLPTELGPLLTQLQTDLEQLLPLLAQVNNNLANLPANFPPTGASAAVPTTGVNLSGNSSVDISSARGANTAVNASTPVAGFSTPVNPAGVALGTNAAAGSLIPPSPTGATNVIGLPPGAFPAAAGTNFLMTPAVLNSLNGLIILQNDAQRMLPLLANLTGSGLDLGSLIPTNQGGFSALTNRPNPVTTDRTLIPSSPPVRTTAPSGRQP